MLNELEQDHLEAAGETFRALEQEDKEQPHPQGGNLE